MNTQTEDKLIEELKRELIKSLVGKSYCFLIKLWRKYCQLFTEYSDNFSGNGFKTDVNELN